MVIFFRVLLGAHRRVSRLPPAVAVRQPGHFLETASLHPPQAALLPAVQALSLYHHGAYEELPAVAQRLLAGAQEQGLTPAGTIRRIYLEGPPQYKDPAKFITQVVLPLREA